MIYRLVVQKNKLSPTTYQVELLRWFKWKPIYVSLDERQAFTFIRFASNNFVVKVVEL